MSMQKPTIHKPLLLSSLVISITLAGCASTATTAPDTMTRVQAGTEALKHLTIISIRLF